LFPPYKIVVYDTKYLNCEVSAFYLPIRVLLLPSGIDPGGCFPRARLQPPRETHSAGSSDTCYSRRSHRPPLTRTGKVIYGRFLCHLIQLKNCVIGKCLPAARIHEDSCGSKGLDETPQCEARGGSLAARGKRSVYGLRLPK